VKIINRHRLSGVIDKQFLAGTMFLAHDRIDLMGPLTVQMTKLAVLIALGVLLFMFLPQQHQSDTFVPQLLVNIGPVRNSALVGWHSGQLGIQQLLQLIVVDINRQRPAQGGLLETKKILGHRAAGNVAAFGDLAIADFTVKL
jgi:hypothetical protein